MTISDLPDIPVHPADVDIPPPAAVKEKIDYDVILAQKMKA